MFHGMRLVCRPSGEGEVVEILERSGVRRAKVMTAGTLVEVAPLGGGEIHLGDRIAFALHPILPSPRRLVAAIQLDDALNVPDDTDNFSGW
jgi:hypothetical protein